jgi:hypothetical protein
MIIVQAAKTGLAGKTSITAMILAAAFLVRRAEAMEYSVLKSQVILTSVKTVIRYEYCKEKAHVIFVRLKDFHLLKRFAPWVSESKGIAVCR